MQVRTNKDKTLERNRAEKQKGFTLIEMMIVVAIIGVLAAIAYPNYQQYVIKTKRTDMMSEMQNIANQIRSRKLAQGNYSNAIITGLGGDYPKSNPLYTVSFTPNPLTSEWSVVATPKPNAQMKSDSPLTLNYQGIKCRGSAPNQKCGSGDEWNK